MTEEEYRRFVQALYSRRHEGVRLRRAQAQIGDWVPAEHECYQNVAIWVRYCPAHTAVDGFLCFDWLEMSGFVRFQLHAVIENELGELVDITPHGAERDWPFIRHIGTSEEFGAVGAQTPPLGVDFRPRDGAIRKVGLGPEEGGLADW